MSLSAVVAHVGLSNGHARRPAALPCHATPRQGRGHAGDEGRRSLDAVKGQGSQNGLV